MEFQDALKKRCSCRSFTNERVSDEDVRKIIAAAQNAPLALGDNQTSHLTVVRDPEIMEALGKRGHDISFSPDTPSFGRGQMIVRLPNGVLVGGTESRTDSNIACL